ncbi:hypothetical protein B0H94_10847 [Salsuginibacillus halophilus]|uniref:Probable membrane transporter protein n=1 Tax=Salsuginibacillus halophilus TaxID=517424 RepID=A0A2P8HDX9_9BACI|nr:sulfite exporter TauE/SafE family protein [Salsuginibacillus halophilus]PSL44436.1 hypothetical protein B0H94_10847 [Salsuginibacillus halophilus]
MVWVLLFVVGITAGAIGSLMGLGGGIIIVPALLMIGEYTSWLQGITPQNAVGTSLLIMVATGLASTLAYVKQRTVDLQAGAIFFGGSGPGALVGVWLNQGLDADAFFVYFGIFVVFVSFILMVRHRLKPLPLKTDGIQRTYINDNGKETAYGFSILPAVSISFIVGMVSGLFGIGGGTLMVPAMILLFGFPPHFAVATSMFMILLSALISSGAHALLGNVEWLYAVVLIPAAWFGAKLGAAFNQRLSSERLVFVFRLFLIIIGLRLIWQGVTGG